MPAARPFHRPVLATLAAGLREPRRHLQVLAGPRQAGKTTLARQAMAPFGARALLASADAATLEDRAWIDQQWERGRLAAREAGRRGALLVLDEVQKVSGWSSAVKRLFDEDTASRTPLRVLVLGSAPLPLQAGLTESLAGRFEVLRVPHWSLPEMEAAFGFDLDRFLYFGGYPGAAPLAGDRARWTAYILDSLVETTVSRDILLLSRVDKPALLRRLLHLGCSHSGEVLSYQKMLGSLADAGNATTLAHYLDLLGGAGMLAGIPKYAGRRVRQRGSSPKLQVLNTALQTAVSGLGPEETLGDPARRGRLVESAVGAHLLNTAGGTGVEVAWWRERDREVDFVLRRGTAVTLLEVKSGRPRGGFPGMDAFERVFGRAGRKLLVGEGGIPVEEFLRRPVADWV